MEGKIFGDGASAAARGGPMPAGRQAVQCCGVYSDAVSYGR